MKKDRVLLFYDTE